MPRYIDANALYERTAEWEASALAYVEKLNRTPREEMSDEEWVEWSRWTAILGERSAFKHDVSDAPTADVVPVVRCKDCKHSSWDELGKCYWCKGKERTADFFCADGERRNNGEIH